MNTFHRFSLICAAMLLIVPAASADWSDNFDSYAVGSGLIGQGGWAGWDGSAAADAFVTDAQSYSTANSAAIIPTSDLVQEFTETTGEFEMTAWCYIPTGSTGDTYFIMLNAYTPDGTANDAWSVQMKFDNDAGILTNEMGPGQTTATIINDTWVEVKAEINLDVNLVDIYYNSVFMEQGPWYDPSDPFAAAEIAALDLFSNGGSTIYWDDCDLAVAEALQQTTWGHIKTIIQ